MHLKNKNILKWGCIIGCILKCIYDSIHLTKYLYSAPFYLYFIINVLIFLFLYFTCTLLTLKIQKRSGR